MSSYENLTILKQLGKGRMSVYLAKSKTNELFAIKVFPFQEDKPSKYYYNECKAISLNHPNLIKILFNKDSKKCTQNQKTICASYLVMDYATKGDFYDFMQNIPIASDEKLVRTYFHQLVSAIEYLHSHRMAHMDLKLENLFLGSDYTLKLGDFDLCYTEEESGEFASGTVCYRAPEQILNKCQNPYKVDIYSAGILLFTWMTGGSFPQCEQLVHGLDLFELMCDESDQFWEFHQKNHPYLNFSQDFRNLFHAMTRRSPDERSTIDEIKKSSWFNQEIYSPEDLVLAVNDLYMS